MFAAVLLGAGRLKSTVRLGGESLLIFKMFIFSCKNKLSRSMQYRFDFIVGLLVSLFMSFAGPVLQLIFFTKVNGFPGWNIGQIILFQGILLIWIGIRDTLFGEMRGAIGGMIQGGSFDRLLLSPASTLLILLVSGFNYFGLGPFFAGIAVTIYAVGKLQLTITAAQICLSVLFMLSGLIFYIGILTLYSATVIQLVTMGRLSEILDKLMLFSEYPLEIYSSVIKWVFITVLPFALWAYFPTQVLLNRFDRVAFISVAASLIFCWLAVKVWHISLKKYSSAGG